MFAWFFEGHDLLTLPVLSMIIFMVIFSGAAISAMRRGRSETNRMSMLPLNDQSGTVSATGVRQTGG